MLLSPSSQISVHSNILSAHIQCPVCDRRWDILRPELFSQPNHLYVTTRKYSLEANISRSVGNEQRRQARDIQTSPPSAVMFPLQPYFLRHAFQFQSPTKVLVAPRCMHVTETTPSVADSRSLPLSRMKPSKRHCEISKHWNVINWKSRRE